MNEFLTNKVLLTDTGVAGGNADIYSQNGLLYYRGEPIAPFTGISSNANEIIMVSIPLVSGVTDQEIVFPQSYAAVPKVVYSIRGQNKEDILAHQISDLSTGFVKISFSHPVPDDNYTLFLFAWKSSNYLTLSGTAYEVNAWRTMNSLRVDSFFGSAGGLRQRLDAPYQTLAQGVSAASAGDTIYFGPGFYTGQSITKNNLTFVFDENAVVSTPISLAADVTGTFYNLQLEISDSSQSTALTVNAGARAIFKNSNYISMPLTGATTKNSINGAGVVELLGDVFHSHRINPALQILQRHDFESLNNVGSGIYVEGTMGATYTGGSGVNNIYTFNGISSALSFIDAGGKLTVKPGNYLGFVLNKNVSVDFEEGAVITSPITISDNITGVFRNLNLQINSIATNGVGITLGSNSLLSFEDTNRINVPNPSGQNFISISGGTVQCLGDLFYNVPFAYGTIFAVSKEYNAFGKNAGIFVDSSLIAGTVSGYNGNIYFSTIQDAINFVTGDEKINVLDGTYGNFNITKPSLEFHFSDKSLVNGVINATTNLGKIHFHNLQFDAQSDTSIGYGLYLPNGTTGVFKDNNFIRLPYSYSPYITTLSGTTVFATGIATRNFSGTFFRDSISGVGISGYYARQDGDLTGYFFETVTGNPITGAYASVSGNFNGSYTDVNSDTVGFYYSGSPVKTYFYNSLVGNNLVSGSYFSGLKFFSNGITGNGILGAYFSGVTVYFFENSIAGTGINGYFWSGRQGSFTNTLATGDDTFKVTGYYASGATAIANTYFTTNINIPLITGYFYSGGYSGLYASGINSIISTGISGSGVVLNPRYSISGDGAAVVYGLVSNQDFSNGINALIGKGIFNSGELFNPWGIAYLP